MTLAGQEKNYLIFEKQKKLQDQRWMEFSFTGGFEPLIINIHFL